MCISSSQMDIGFDLHILPYSKTCVKQPFSKSSKIGFQDQLWLNAGQKYCRMLQRAFFNTLTFITLPFVIKIFVMSIFEWPFYTGFTVPCFFFQVMKALTRLFAAYSSRLV